MEMVFVMSESKPPFVGIVFSNEIEASQLNKNWVEDYKNYEWKARVELQNNKLLFCVWALRTKLRHTYEITIYNKKNLNFFLKECYKAKQINYGHIIRDQNGFKIATTPKFKKWAIKLESLETYEEQGL